MYCRIEYFYFFSKFVWTCVSEKVKLSFRGRKNFEIVFNLKKIGSKKTDQFQLI